jgi:D-hydroxyproline dehydrogenase subunit alpha
MTRHIETDVVVVGGGPAGMAAAACAAERGVSVLLIDDGPRPGGQIWRASLASRSPVAARRWAQRLSASGAVVLSCTSVVDLHASPGIGFMVDASGADGASQIAARRLVLATGARERFLPFPGWTLPGVFGIGGAQALLKTGLSFRGRRVVIAGSGPLLLPVAASLAAAGARLAVVAEQAPARRVAGFAASLWRKPLMLVEAIRLRAACATTPYSLGTWITEVRGDGETGVRSAVVTNGRSTREIACDAVCAGFGLVPNTEAARHVGCAIDGGAVRVDDHQATTVRDVFCAGEPTGIGGVELSLVEGQIAGAAAAGAAPGAGAGAPISDRLVARRRSLRRYAGMLDTSFSLRPDVTALGRPDTVVCRCEDVRLGELNAQWSSRQAKLYTRAGMGACQGRVCGAALESIMGWTTDAVRPPIQPTQLATMLGDGDSTEHPH